MTEPKWLSKRGVLASHAKQIALHGGPHGLHDEGLLESALARPQHLHAYGTPDLAELAAVYAFGLARNHAFVDGNKRTSFVACFTFLLRNGMRLEAPDDEKVSVWLALADGSLEEHALASWIRSKIFVEPR